MIPAYAELKAADTYTDWIAVGDHGCLTITGTFVGTLTLQHKQFKSGAISPVQEFTAVTEPPVTLDGRGEFYRVGFKAGAYTSGTAVVTLKG